MLVSKGADSRTLVMFYLVVVKVVLLYGSEMWVMSPRIWSKMGGFHHSMVPRLAGRQMRRRTDVMWVYPPLTEAMVETMEEAGLQEVDTYVTRCQNTVSQYIATIPIMKLCLPAE